MNPPRTPSLELVNDSLCFTPPCLDGSMDSRVVIRICGLSCKLNHSVAPRVLQGILQVQWGYLEGTRIVPPERIGAPEVSVGIPLRPETTEFIHLLFANHSFLANK